MNIMVGGGKIGREIARRSSESVIIEIDSAKAKELEGEGLRVINGDARNREILLKAGVNNARVILVTDSDDVNLEVAELAKRLGSKEIVSRIVDPSRAHHYRKAGIIGLVCDESNAANLLTIVANARRKYFEMKVSEDSGLAGKELHEVSLEEDCAVISIFRKGMLFRPIPGIMLQPGDVIGAVCGKEVQQMHNPFDRILVIFRYPEFRDIVVEEASKLASQVGAEVFGISKEKENGLSVCSLEDQLPSLDGVGESEIVELLKHVRGKFDLIVTDAPRRKIFSLWTKDFTWYLNPPFLIAKRGRRYSKILVVVNTSDPSELFAHLKALSHPTVGFKVLILDEELLPYQNQLVEVSNVDIELVKGNPIIEVVKEVKRDYDLVMFSLKNDLGNIDQPLLWKIVEKTPSSVLVVE